MQEIVDIIRSSLLELIMFIFAGGDVKNIARGTRSDNYMHSQTHRIYGERSESIYTLLYSLQRQYIVTRWADEV